MKTSNPLSLRKIDFYKDKTVVHLHVDPRYRKTSQIEGFAQKCLQNYPRLKYHLCDNDLCLSFCEELEDTELAHAFEHVVLDLIGQRDKKIERVKGFTEWNWQEHQKDTYQLHFDYNDKALLENSISDALLSFQQLTSSSSV